MSKTGGPLKIELTTEKDKVTLLQNLKKIKGDFNFKKRMFIQEYNAEAKERTENDPEGKFI